MQTQDRCFSEKDYCTASSQGQMYSKKVVARYLCCGGNLFFRHADLMFRDKSGLLAFAQSGSMLIEKFDLNQSFAFFENSVLSKKATHFHNPIASHSMSVITYCYQKNPLRVHTKPHIRLCYAWSSQRFKSLSSILCKIVVCAKPVTCRKPVIPVKTTYRPAI